MAHAVIVTGAPGVGKSAVCRALAARLPVAAHVEADRLHRFLVSGGQWPSAGTATARDQLILRTRNAATVAVNFVAAGIPAFVDEVVCTPEQVAVLDELLPGAPVVVLTAPEDVVAVRDAGRHKHTAARYTGVAADIAAVVGPDAPRVATAGLDIEQTVAAVLVSLAGRPGR